MLKRCVYNLVSFIVVGELCLLQNCFEVTFTIFVSYAQYFSILEVTVWQLMSTFGIQYIYSTPIFLVMMYDSTINILLC